MASKRNKHEEHAAKTRLQMFEAKQELEVIKQVRRSRDNRMALLVSIATLVVVVALQSVYFGFGPGHQVAIASASASNAKLVPPISAGKGKIWPGTLTINNAALRISVDGKVAPQAASNVIVLATKKFFNDTKCHRLTNSGVYILQCGDPTGTGSGGPGYTFGPIENAPNQVMVPGTNRKAGFYPAGTIAMARQSNKADSQGSQFFIVYKDSYFPNDTAGGYTVFGHIVSGLNLLTPFIDAGIANKSNDGSPAKEIKINSLVFDFMKPVKPVPAPTKSAQPHKGSTSGPTPGGN